MLRSGTAPERRSGVLKNWRAKQEDVDAIAEARQEDPFAVLGPHLMEAGWVIRASRVSVVADFNQWDGRKRQMRKRIDSGLWEVFVRHLDAGAVYKDEIVSADGLVQPLKADPCEQARRFDPARFKKSNGLERRSASGPQAEQRCSTRRPPGPPREGATRRSRLGLLLTPVPADFPEVDPFGGGVRLADETREHGQVVVHRLEALDESAVPGRNFETLGDAFDGEVLRGRVVRLRLCPQLFGEILFEFDSQLT